MSHLQHSVRHYRPRPHNGGGLSRRMKVLRRYLSPEARTTGLLSALIAILFAFPSCLSALRSNENLRQQVIDMQARIASMEEAARQAAAFSDRSADEDDGAASEEGAQASGVVPVAPPVVTAAPPRFAGAAAARLLATPREVGLSGLDLTMLPTGVRVPTQPEGAAVPAAPEVDPLAQQLAQGYALLENGQRRDAAVVWEVIVAARPDWPYGHYYYALASGRRAAMERAARLFARAAEEQRMPPEGHCYHALVRLFLRDTEGASVALEELATGYVDQPLSLGPLYAPIKMPDDCRRRLEGLKRLPVLRQVAWLQEG